MEPTPAHIGSGQEAALAGGTTFHIDFALPVDGDLLAGFAAWQHKAERAVMDYGFHMAVTKWSDKVRGGGAKTFCLLKSQIECKDAVETLF
jgi:dihydroorotase-like cyclic amidohydrolase